MVKKKNKTNVLKVFKGREAKLNFAILIILIKNSPQVIYDIAKAVRVQKGLTKTKYTNVNRRVKALEKKGFLSKAGSRNTLQGFQGTLFSPTTKAYLSFFLNKLDLDSFIEEADESILISELANLTLFFENAEDKESSG